MWHDCMIRPNCECTNVSTFAMVHLCDGLCSSTSYLTSDIVLHLIVLGTSLVHYYLSPVSLIRWWAFGYLKRIIDTPSVYSFHSHPFYTSQCILFESSSRGHLLLMPSLWILHVCSLDTYFSPQLFLSLRVMLLLSVGLYMQHPALISTHC